MLLIVLFILSRSTASGQTFNDIGNNTEIRNETKIIIGETTEVLVRDELKELEHENVLSNYKSETMPSEITISFAPVKTLGYQKIRLVPLNTVQ